MAYTARSSFKGDIATKDSGLVVLSFSDKPEFIIDYCTLTSTSPMIWI